MNNSAQPCGCDPGCNHVCRECSVRKAYEAHNAKLILDAMEREDKAFVAVGNGVQQDFGTGATRSSDTGKIDFEGHISPFVLQVFGEYMNAHRVQRDGKIRGSDNWQSGIPMHRYVKSLIRHVIEFWTMWRGAEVKNPDANGKPFTFQEVLSAILFNVMGIIFEMDYRLQGNRHPDRLLMPWLEMTRLAPEDRVLLEQGDNQEATKLVTREQLEAVAQTCYKAGLENERLDPRAHSTYFGEAPDNTPDARYMS